MLVITGSATIAMLVVLQAVYGLAEGFYLPASTGLIPATISPGRLQQANALLGLARNATRIVGPAIGGAIVAAGSPGSALLIDAASFALGALLLLPLRLPTRADVVEAEAIPRDVVTMNSEVRLQDLDSGDIKVYRLVFPSQARTENSISILAPIGTAMLGYRVGDVIEWRVPKGIRRLKVLDVLYQPEAAGVCGN